jgi:hypothetical protein
MPKMKAISLPKTLAKAQKAFNAFIRFRDAEKPCVACGKYKIEHASHFYSVGSFSHLRFNEDNVHGSCMRCNYFLSGNLIEYRKSLEKRIGKERLELLDYESKRKIKKWAIYELEEIISTYKSKVKSGS